MNAKKVSFPVLIKSLAAGTAIATVFCVLWNLHAPRDWLLSAAITFGTTCYHLTMRLLVGFIGSHIPIRENSRWFQPRPFEQKLYRVLRVKRWKSAMPTYDPDSFSLQKNTLEQVIRNSCTAELVHTLILPLSFLPLFAARLWGAFPVFLVTSILAALLDSAFIIMQRYNRPRLVRILKKKEAFRE